MTCNAVVLCAGSWSGEHRDSTASRSPFRCVRSVDSCCTSDGRPPLRRVTWSSRCYLVPWEDGTLLVGATVEEAGFDERTTVAGVRGLLDASARSFRARGRRISRRARRAAAGDDRRPAGNRTVHGVPNLIYATGHYRNGVLLAPLTAQLVADAMLDNRIDPLACAVESVAVRRLVMKTTIGDEDIHPRSDARGTGDWVARADARRHRRSIWHRVRRRRPRRRRSPG